jgi:hypothetical protein
MNAFLLSQGLRARTDLVPETGFPESLLDLWFEIAVRIIPNRSPLHLT